MRDGGREGGRERREKRVREVHVPYFLHTDSIVAGVSSMNIITTSNAISINFSISDDITCLVHKERIGAHICYALKTNTTCDSAEFEPTNCHNRSVGESTVKFQGLIPDTTYCIRANVSYRGASRVYAQSATTPKESTTSGM